MITFYNSKNTDQRAGLVNYESYPWAHKHFQELRERPIEYHDYSVWRGGEFNGETINVSPDGVRKTIGYNNSDSNLRKVYFFGGSTMWGSGVIDEFTIPSLFNQEFKVNSTNFGESGHIARQSLAILIDEYIKNGKKDHANNGKKNIIFYNGVNEVANMCRTEVKEMSTPREAEIRNKLNSKSLEFSYLVRPLADFVHKIRLKFDLFGHEKSMYRDCFSYPNKAERVALSLVKTWSIASKLAKQNGDEFLAILQPVAFIGNADVSNLQKIKSVESRELKKQYMSVYPLIRRYATRDKNLNFVDFSDIYDDKKVYIDFCHVSPQGNFLVISEFKKYQNLINL